MQKDKRVVYLEYGIQKQIIMKNQAIENAYESMLNGHKEDAIMYLEKGGIGRQVLRIYCQNEIETLIQNEYNYQSVKNWIFLISISGELKRL